MWLLAIALAAAQTPPAATVSLEARSIQPGEVVRVVIRTADDAERVTTTALGRTWTTHRVDARTWEAILGIDLGAAVRTQDVVIAITTSGRTSTIREPLAVKSKTFTTRRLTVASAFVDPPASEQPRIAAEAAELGRLWAASSPERLWSGPFVRPVPHEANSAFGSRSVFNGQARSPHGGADFMSPAGTPVAAPNAGRVVLARDLYFTGGTVVVDHGQGIVSLFAHLQAIDVAVGQAVASGDVLGRVGKTGRVTGPHLHWTVRAGGARVDPLSLLAVMGGR